MAGDIHSRKRDHIEIAASGRGAFRETTTLLEEVELVHQALPQLSLDEIDLSLELFGRKLRAPLLIGAMTGGTEESGRINEELARVAADLGIGFCLGSQRVSTEHPDSLKGFRIREKLPELLLIGNIGVVQARELGPGRLGELAEGSGVDAMSIHLNPAQEMVQTGGDRDFRGCIEALAELEGSVDLPLMVKETGCGISRQAGAALAESGFRYVEVAGAGGTSWARVEAEREPSRRWVGEMLGEWGIPTAASLLMLEGLPLFRIAGGGLRSPLDLARAFALGARACSLAQPVLTALLEGGSVGAREYLERLIEGLRVACLLAGCRSPSELALAPRVIGPRLERWQRAGKVAAGGVNGLETEEV